MLSLHVGPPGLFSVFHQSTHLSVPPSLHPFILLVLLIINPSAQHPSLYSVLCVLVWPTLLTTETLNPRPRDPQETKFPCVGHGELTACEPEALRCVGGFTPASPGLPYVLSLVGSQRLCFLCSAFLALQASVTGLVFRAPVRAAGVFSMSLSFLLGLHIGMRWPCLCLSQLLVPHPRSLCGLAVVLSPDL